MMMMMMFFHVFLITVLTNNPTEPMVTAAVSSYTYKYMNFTFKMQLY